MVCAGCARMHGVRSLFPEAPSQPSRPFCTLSPYHRRSVHQHGGEGPTHAPDAPPLL